LIEARLDYNVSTRVEEIVAFSSQVGLGSIVKMFYSIAKKLEAYVATKSLLENAICEAENKQGSSYNTASLFGGVICRKGQHIYVVVAYLYH